VFVPPRRLGPAVTLIALALLASGCGGGDQPKTLPPLTTRPAASASPTANPKTELAAVEAVVRQYYALLNRPTSAANATALSALMTPTCSCQEVVKATRQALARHEHYFGTNHVVRLVPNIDGPTQAEVLASYDYTESGLRDARNHVLSMGRGRRGTTQNFQLTKFRSQWLIVVIIRIAPGEPQ
jgi:hypothetical protein